MIRIHIAFNGKVKSIESEDTDQLKKLNLSGKIISSLDEITEISINEDLIIITTEDPAFRNGDEFIEDISRCSRDRIKVYDWNGNLQLSIGDIIKDIDLPIYGGFLIEKSTIVDYMEDISILDEQPCLYACFAGAWKYVLDLKSNRVLLRLATK